MGLKMFDLPPDGIQDGAVAKLDKEQSTSTEVKPQIVTEQVSPDDPIKKKVKMPDGATYPEGSEEYDRIVKEYKLEKPGIKAAMRTKLAVHMMKVEIPLNVIDELNDHIDKVNIPANDDYSDGLVGQINRDKRSAQLYFPHNDDGVGKQFSDVITRMGSEYIDRVVGIRSEIEMQSMWTVHSYEGDYNPVHDHGTKTPMGLSCILYLKVPPQIEKLGNPAEHFEGLNESSGAIDGFTYLTWGVNGMRDINILRPITEEYVKPEVGTMLMFPAWLRHGVMPFFGDGERRTFSCNMNVTPTERLTGDHYRKTREE